ncbi:hypothetical protein [Clostridium kluyveri]|nr:hypothetical protein [Clostridium kluyveri]
MLIINGKLVTFICLANIIGVHKQKMINSKEEFLCHADLIEVVAVEM